MASTMMPWFKECEASQWGFPKFSSVQQEPFAVWLKIPWVVASRCLSNLHCNILVLLLRLVIWRWPLKKGTPRPTLQKHFVVRPAAAGSGSLGTQHDPAWPLSGDGGWWGFDVLICFDMFWYWNSFWISELTTSHCTGFWLILPFALEWLDMTWPLISRLQVWSSDNAGNLSVLFVQCSGYTLTPASTSCNHVVRQLTQTDKQRGI